MSDSHPDSPTPALPSRREVLLSAAGALALGLGAPVGALAATARNGRAPDAKLTFHRGQNARPFHAVDLPEEVAKVLGDPRSRVFIKVEWSKEAIPALDGSSKVEGEERMDKATPKLMEEIKQTYALTPVR